MPGFEATGYAACQVGYPPFTLLLLSTYCAAAARSGVNRYMTALLLQFVVSEKKLEAVQASAGDAATPAGQTPVSLRMCSVEFWVNYLRLLLCCRTQHPSWASWLLMCWRHASPCFHASS